MSNYLLLVVAVYLIAMATIMQTRNIQSSIFFKFIPMTLGIALVLKHYAVI